MKTTFVGGLGIAVMALASSVAQADGHEGDSFGTLTGNLGVASEYVFRGLPSSNNAAQVSGGIDWNYENVYAGTWLSNVGDGATGNEVDLYAGITAGDFDFGWIVYAFPGAVNARASKLAEVYVGYTHGMLSTYAWYGLGGASRSDDDYLYLEANVTAPVTEESSLGFHAGYQVFHGKTFDRGNPNYTADQLDLALTYSVGGLWFSLTTILDTDTNGGANKRPRINAGYSWTFEDLMPVRLNF
ncbi:MAG: TorF family putative porin [Oceanococcus sp.]